MEDIKYVQLSEIAELITKGTTPTTLGYEFQDEGVKFLKAECFDENGGFIENKAAHISEECHEKLKRSQLKAGDILFSIAGAIGRVAIVSEEMLPANTNQALAIIRISDEQVYLPYIKLILTSPIVIEQFERKKQGVAQLNLSLKDINEISIPLPIKEKQIELAELFAKVVRVISKRSMELSLLDDLIKARFVEMFGDPIINSKHLETKELKDILILKAGDFTAASDIADEPSEFNPYPCYGGNGIRGYVVEYNQEGEYSLVGRQGALSGNVQFASGKFKNTEHALLVTPIVEMNCIWLNQLLVNLDLKRYQTGAAQPGLSVKNLQEIKILCVSIDEQKAFADFVRQVDKSKLMFQKLHQKLNILRQKAGNI